jgi:hypothetical protein
LVASKPKRRRADPGVDIQIGNEVADTPALQDIESLFRAARAIDLVVAEALQPIHDDKLGEGIRMPKKNEPAHEDRIVGAGQR